MDEQEHLVLERRLEDVLGRDLGAIPVRPFAAYNRPMPSTGNRVRSLAGAIALLAIVLVLALGAASALRQLRPVPATTPLPSASEVPTPSATPSVPTIIASPSPTATAPTTGTITGRLGYPSDFVPPLTVYAISVSDSSVWFSTDTPRFGNPLSATPPPGGPTWPPSGDGTYSISRIPPGTYYVIAYRNDGAENPQYKNFPGAYTQWAAKCASSDPAVPSPPPGPCSSDRTLVPVSVAAGQTVSYIDIVDWFFQGGSYPPRPR